MINKNSLTILIVLISFFIFFPRLVHFPFSSFLPKLILASIIIGIFILRKTKKIRLDLITIILIIYSISLSLTYVLNENTAVLRILFYAVFFLLILETGISIPIKEKLNEKSYLYSYQIIFISCFFLILPLSVIIQYLFPSIAEYYYYFIIYDEKLNENFTVNDGKYSGLTGGIGVGGSTALASILIFYEIIQYYFFDSTKIVYKFISTTIRAAYLIAIVMCGTTGLILPALYYLLLFLFKQRLTWTYIGKLIFIVVSFYLLLKILLPFIEIEGLSYLKILIEADFKSFLNHRSMGSLVGQYEDFPKNFEFVLDNAGFFGNPMAVGLYDISDIGFLNQINLTGLSGLLLFNAYLVSCLFIAQIKTKGRLVCRSDQNLRFALMSVTLYSFIVQFKEFSSLQGNGPQALAIILLITLFSLRNKNLALEKNYKYLTK
jgi:hypothetical protein